MSLPFETIILLPIGCISPGSSPLHRNIVTSVMFISGSFPLCQQKTAVCFVCKGCALVQQRNFQAAPFRPFFFFAFFCPCSQWATTATLMKISRDFFMWRAHGKQEWDATCLSICPFGTYSSQTKFHITPDTWNHKSLPISRSLSNEPRQMIVVASERVHKSNCEQGQQANRRVQQNCRCQRRKLLQFGKRTRLHVDQLQMTHFWLLRPFYFPPWTLFPAVGWKSTRLFFGWFRLDRVAVRKLDCVFFLLLISFRQTARFQNRTKNEFISGVYLRAPWICLCVSMQL